MAKYSKSICRGGNGAPPCPVRFKCLLTAWENGEEHGIWGGFSHRERNALERKLAKRHLTIRDYCTTEGKP